MAGADGRPEEGGDLSEDGPIPDLLGQVLRPTGAIDEDLRRPGKGNRRSGVSFSGHNDLRIEGGWEDRDRPGR